MVGFVLDVPEPYRLSGLSTMRRAVTLIAAISLTQAGVILSYVEAEGLITFRLGCLR
jgi:hypothetical protein